MNKIDQIKAIFAEAADNEGWNLQEEMLYSFFFLDKDVQKLEKLGLHLESEGFDFVEIGANRDEETEEDFDDYLLQIDKIAAYTPESLAQQLEEFEKLAKENGINSFDGWEFGEIEVEVIFEDEEE